MAKYLCTFALIVLLHCAFSSATNWCKPWNGFMCLMYGTHTLCKHQPNVYSPTCGTVVKPGLTQQEKQRILNLHNSLRQNVARGQERRGNPGPQPAARNMQNLEWDDELALVAQTWANQCEFYHACSDVERFPVGQNVGYQSHAQVEDIVNGWYDEVRNLNKNAVTSMRLRQNSFVNHYTQLVWADTNKLGCGAVTYSKNNDGYEILHLVCNYGPTGNIADKIYETA